MKTNLIKTIFAALSLLCATTAKSYDFIYDYMLYNITSHNTVELTSDKMFVPYKGNIVIPATVKYQGSLYHVTRIGDGAFEDATKLTSVKIPGCVTNIEDGAFRGCENLVYLTIPNSVTNVGTGAFACTGLKMIELPHSIKKIEVGTFSECRQ